MAARFESGFTVREPAWHGLSTVLQDYPGRDDAMRLAGHDWLVKENNLTLGDGRPVDEWKALTRSDTGKVLSVVRDSYHPIQNSTLWDIVDAIVKQPNVKYDTAGVLREGCTLWVMAKLDEPWTVPGDDSATVPYIMASTAHDGTHATTAVGMGVRVVCWNTWQMAIREAQKKGLYYAFRHTANVQERLDEARESLSTVRTVFERYKELTTELAKHPVTRDGVTEFIMRFIPDPRPGEATPRAVTWINEARAKYAALLGGPTVAEAHRSTAYGLWCAGIEFLDHERAYRTNDTYFNRCTTPSKFKETLHRLALDVSE